jgi:hypothetical protein
VENTEEIPIKIDVSSIFDYSSLNAAGFIINSENCSINSKNKQESSFVQDFKFQNPIECQSKLFNH